MEIVETHLFRVTRNADLAIEEDEADDLLAGDRGGAPAAPVRRGRPARGRAVDAGDERRDPPARARPRATTTATRSTGMLDLTGLGQLPASTGRTSRSPPWTPGDPGPRSAAGRGRARRRLRRRSATGDLLVHHPYESFSASSNGSSRRRPTTRTCCRSSRRSTGRRGDSPIVRALIRAAESGKQVVVLVEIKARFDEEANIVWARKLERAGAHVVYGLIGLKTHCKMRWSSGARATGSVATSTSAPATTTRRRPALRGPRPADVPPRHRRRRHGPVQRPHRAVAPADVPPAARRADRLRPASSSSSTARSSTRRRAGRPASSSRSTRSSTPPASRRCTAPPRPASTSTDRPRRLHAAAGCAGLSEHIRVRSIVGEFLEHSRIWRFENGGDREWFIGSADLMDRNLDRRVEALVPVDDHEARARMDRIIRVML